MDYIIHGVAKSWTRLSNFHFTSLQSFYWTTELNGFSGVGGVDFKATNSDQNRFLPFSGTGSGLRVSTPSGLLW